MIFSLAALLSPICTSIMHRKVVHDVQPWQTMCSSVCATVNVCMCTFRAVCVGTTQLAIKDMQLNNEPKYFVANCKEAGLNVFDFGGSGVSHTHNPTASILSTNHGPPLQHQIAKAGLFCKSRFVLQKRCDRTGLYCAFAKPTVREQIT